MTEIALTFKAIPNCNVRTMQQGQVARIGERVVTFHQVVFKPKHGQTIQDAIMIRLRKVLADHKKPWTVLHYGTHWYVYENAWHVTMAVIQNGTIQSLLTLEPEHVNPKRIVR